MHLFYIRNKMTIRLAEEIIKQYNLNSCIALVHNTIPENYQLEMSYSESLISNMDKKLWNKIFCR